MDVSDRVVMRPATGGTGDTRLTRLTASRNARTRKDDAKGLVPSRLESTDATSPPILSPRERAISLSTSQNAGSNATLVRWPASEKLRLISPASFRLLFCQKR
jgi:hypothetical protein